MAHIGKSCVADITFLKNNSLIFLKEVIFVAKVPFQTIQKTELNLNTNEHLRHFKGSKFSLVTRKIELHKIKRNI